MPPDLEPFAKRMWEKLSVDLVSLGVITLYDGLALRLLCESWQKYLETKDEIARDGWTVEWKSGKRAHPSARMNREAWGQIVELCRHFGLTPLSRTGLPVGEEVQDTDEEEALRWSIDPGAN